MAQPPDFDNRIVSTILLCLVVLSVAANIPLSRPHDKRSTTPANDSRWTSSAWRPSLGDVSPPHHSSYGPATNTRTRHWLSRSIVGSRSLAQQYRAIIVASRSRREEALRLLQFPVFPSLDRKVVTAPKGALVHHCTCGHNDEAYFSENHSPTNPPVSGTSISPTARHTLSLPLSAPWLAH